MKFQTKPLIVLLAAVCLVGCKPKQPPESVQEDLPKAPAAQPAVQEAPQPAPLQAEPVVAEEPDESEPAAEAAPLKAMLLTGQSAEWHPWQVSSPILKRYLEETGLFEVDVARSPAKDGDMDKFRPNFEDYDVVVMDYEGDYWSEATQAAFVKYIKSGGGVVFFHAANNAFPKWKEFNVIAGIGGWGGRDEKSGPMVRYRDGRIVHDNTPGEAGDHGPAHVFQIINRERNHPITRGLPTKWMHAKDELYAKLRGPAQNLTILSTAYAAPAKGGTGEHEPLLFTIDYGRGRAFNTALGHANEEPLTAVECVGFITTFQRGAEWAATGEVTQPVPADFPTATEVSKRKRIKQVNVAGLLEKISVYKYGDSREPQTELEAFLRSALDSEEVIKKAEKQLVQLLLSDATLDAKQFVCRQLSVIGSQYSVPVLAVMLVDSETADMARYALERIEDQAVDETLRGALSGATGKDKMGIINTLGARGDEKSVKVLGDLIYQGNLQIAAAAVSALGQIADSGAADVLAKASGKTNAELKRQVLYAYINCADNLAGQGDKAKALEIYKQAYSAGNPEPVRIAGLRGIVLLSEQDAGDFVVDAIGKETGRLQSQAIALVRGLKDPAKIKAAAEYLPNLSVTGQNQLLAALADCGQPGAARAVVVEAIKSEHQDVRIAAVKTLGALGGESSVVLLAEAAALSTGPERRAARQSLQNLRGTGVNDRIVGSVLNAEPAVKIELIRSIAQRRIQAGAAALLITAQDADSKVRIESWKAIREVKAGDLRELIRLMLDTKNNTERKEAERAVAAVAGTYNEDIRTDPLLEALSSAPNATAGASLLRVLGMAGGAGAFDVLRTALTEEEPELVDAGVRGLSGWSGDEPMSDLLKIAQTSDSEVHKVLALRGYVRMIGLDQDRDAQDTVKLYRQAMDAASDAGAKKMVLSGLAEVKSVAAMNFVADYFDDDELSSEAGSAVTRIAAGLIRKGVGAECIPFLEKVIATAKNEELREGAQQMIARIEEDGEEEGED
ncbi:MAG: HEAT repeat domain-containing protein [Planctomycetota bacterium]